MIKSLYGVIEMLEGLPLTTMSVTTWILCLGGAVLTGLIIAGLAMISNTLWRTEEIEREVPDEGG